MGAFIDGNGQGYSLRLPKKYRPPEQAFWCTRNFHGNDWSSGCLGYSELPNNIPTDVKGEKFAKGTEECKVLGRLLVKKCNNCIVMAVPKFKILLMNKCGFGRASNSDTRRHFTVADVSQKIMVNG